MREGTLAISAKNYLMFFNLERLDGTTRYTQKKMKYGSHVENHVEQKFQLINSKRYLQEAQEIIKTRSNLSITETPYNM